MGQIVEVVKCFFMFPPRRGGIHEAVSVNNCCMEIITKLLWVFLAGGGICMVGQLLILRTNWTPSRILTAFVVAGVVLGALQLFEPIKKAVSSGITVPIVGFGGTLSKGVIEAVKRDGFVGIFTGGVAAAAAGIATAVTFALLVALVARSRSKKS